MREIKFRAWSFTNKKMYYRVLAGNTLTDDPCSSVYSDEDNTWKNFDKHCGVLMQYTGLKDKNGKEIYQDDIVKDEFGQLRQIMWFQPECKFIMATLKISPFHTDFVPWDIRDCEIIGNIYENPELYNATQEK